MDNISEKTEVNSPLLYDKNDPRQIEYLENRIKGTQHSQKAN